MTTDEKLARFAEMVAAEGESKSTHGDKRSARIAFMAELAAEGVPIAQLARIVGVSDVAIHKQLNAAGAR